jgi:iron complex outermembrane receptor protein
MNRTMDSPNRRLVAGLGLAFGVAFAAPALLSQEAQAPVEGQQTAREAQVEGQETQPPDETFGDVIYVTARRREEPLQTTPVAVTAVLPEVLEERNITDIEELTAVAPNLKLDAATYTSTAARIYIRGVGQDDPVVTADPGVGVYVDGVYLGRAQASLQAINDVERIEVLRGPQGTLFGRNTIGGAINIVTAAPASSFAGQLFARGGNRSLVESRFSLNAPATDELWLRLATATVKNEGFMTNAVDGSRRNDRDLVGGRFALRFDPSSSFLGDLAVDYTTQDRSSSIGECLYTGSGALVAVANAFGFRSACDATRLDGDPYLGASDFLDTDESDAGGATLTLGWQGGRYGVQSISAYREGETELALDIDQSAVDYFDQVAASDFDQISQELQLNGSTERMDFTVGAYYFREDVGAFDHTETLTQFPLTPRIAPINNLNTDVTRAIDNDSLALYGQSSVDLGDRFSLTAGLRYTEETKDIDYLSRLFLTDTIATDVTQRLDFEELTGLLSAAYEFTDRIFGYASANRGFKSGGFNGRVQVGSPQIETFEPEFVNAYELGLKTSSERGRVVANGALYWSDYEDLQLTIFQTTPQGGFASVVRNAGQATVRGAELELRAITGAGIQLFAQLGLTDAEYDEFFADLDGDGVPTDNTDLDFKHTPEWVYGVGIQYSRAVFGDELLTLQAEVDARAETFTNTANTPGTEITQRELLHARVAYDFLGGKLQLGLWGRNLTDETYTTTGLSFADSLGFNIVIYAPPRTYGADLRWRF